MYTVTVTRSFPAQHVLTVPDAGPEGELHTHWYELEFRLSGESLNEYGYLVDIDDVTAALDRVVDRYEDETLNDLAEFDGNPSLERFARVLCDRLLDDVDAPRVDAPPDDAAPIDAPPVEAATVRLWEDEDAWAAYERAV